MTEQNQHDFAEQYVQKWAEANAEEHREMLADLERKEHNLRWEE